MSIKEIDFLSPKITLFYYGSKRHKSFVGAIITLIMVMLSALYVFYLIMNIINHKSSNFMSYKTYLTDAGHYIFNDTTGIYHYFQIYDIENKVFGQYNSKYIRIFMSRLYRSYQNNQSLLSDNEHWVYDICREGEDNKNINKGIFNKETYFYQGACLRYYYNNEIKKYFPIEDKNNFKYPYLIHGSGRSENLYLETIIEKCDNSSVITDLLGNCASEIEINEYLERYMGVYMQLLEKQVITNDYENPIYEYISGIPGSLDSSSVPVNNINLSPFHIEIKNGVFLPETQKIITYYFDNNSLTTWENSRNKKILSIFVYWLNNSCQIIKGGYSTLYDILPSIGGIIQLIYYIFYSFNFLYNKFIVIHDCNRAFFRMYNSEDFQNLKAKKKFMSCINSIREEVKLAQSKHKNDNYKRHSLFERNKAMKQKKTIQNINNKDDINNNINNYINNNMNKNNKKKCTNTEINFNKELVKYINYNNNQLIDISNSNDLMIALNNNKIINNNINNIKIINNNKRKSISNDKKDDLISGYFHDSDKINSAYYQFSYQLKEFLNQKRKSFKIEPLNERILKKFLSFYNYILSFIGSHYSQRGFLVLNKFREKLLGEEHLFRTNIFLYHLEKYFNIKETEKIDIFELYENL